MRHQTRRPKSHDNTRHSVKRQRRRLCLLHAGQKAVPPQVFHSNQPAHGGAQPGTGGVWGDREGVEPGADGAAAAGLERGGSESPEPSPLVAVRLAVRVGFFPGDLQRAVADWPGDAALAADWSGGVRAEPRRRAEHQRGAGTAEAPIEGSGAGGRGHHGVWGDAMQHRAQEVAERGLSGVAACTCRRGERHHGAVCGEVWRTRAGQAGIHPHPAAEGGVGRPLPQCPRGCSSQSRGRGGGNPRPEARNPKEIRNPRSEGGLGRVGGRDAMHKGAIPYIHRSITGAVPSEHGWRMGSAECGMRNAECGMAVWPKPAEAVTSVSCGAALKGGSVRGRRGQVPSPHNSFVRREGAGYLVLSDRCMSCLLCRAR